jgi:hypothetical protein
MRQVLILVVLDLALVAVFAGVWFAMTPRSDDGLYVVSCQASWLSENGRIVPGPDHCTSWPLEPSPVPQP